MIFWTRETTVSAGFVGFLFILLNIPWISCSECKFALSIVQYNVETKSLKTIRKINCEQDGGAVLSHCDVYLKIMLSCDEDEITLYAMNQVKYGFEPYVNVLSKNKDGHLVHHIIDVAAIKTESCVKYDNQPTDNCDTMWLAKLPLNSKTKCLDVIVSGNNVGMIIDDIRSTFHTNLRTFQDHLQAVKFFSQSLTCPSTSTLSLQVKKSEKEIYWLDLTNNLIVLHEWNIDGIVILKPNLDTLSVFPVVCKSLSVLQDVITLEDSVLLATQYGVFEFIAPVKEGQLVCDCCIELFQKYSWNGDQEIVIAKNSKMLYWVTGKKKIFTEILNEKNQSVLDWLEDKQPNNSKCTINDMTSSGFRLYALFTCQRHDNGNITRLIQITLSTNIWSYNMLLIMDMYMDVDKLSVLNIASIILWGNKLFTSSDGGRSFSELLDNTSSVSSLTYSTTDGTFVVTTVSKQFFAGIAGRSTLQQLHTEDTMTHIEFVFTPHGHLNQIVQQNESCYQFNSFDIESQLKEIKESDWSTHLQRPIEIGYYKKRLKEYNFISYCPYSAFQISSSKKRYLNREEHVITYYSNKMGMEPYVTLNNLTVSLTTARYDEAIHDIMEKKDYAIEEISLGFLECFDFVMVVSLKDTNGQFLWTTSDIELSHHISSHEDLALTIEREIDYFDAVVRFKMVLCDKGKQKTQTLPGIIQKMNHLNLMLYPYHDDCFKDGVQTHYDLLIRHGCPSRRRIFIDFLKSKQGYKHFCDEENCFFYERSMLKLVALKVFRPVFMLLDEATGEINVYKGFYTLQIIGGGPQENSITLYSEREVKDYNTKTGATLAWSWSTEDNGYQWLCGTSSPCGSITPTFPDAPLYYLKLQFSNVVSDESNCDYTFNFTMKLHGIPPGGLYPSLVIVLVTVGVICLLVAILFLLETTYPEFFPNIKSSFPHWKTLVSVCVIKKDKVDKCSSTSSNILMDKGTEHFHTINGSNHELLTKEDEELTTENKSTGMSEFNMIYQEKCRDSL